MRWAVWLAIAGAVSMACAQRTGEAALVDVRRGDLVVAVEVSGELAAVDSTDVTMPALSSGSADKVSWLAPEGSEVKPGDPIATLDASEIDRAIESLETTAKEAGKQLDKTRQEAVLAQRQEDLKLLEQEAAVQKAALKIEAAPELVAAVDRRELELDHQLAQLALDQVRHAAAMARDAREVKLRGLADLHARLRRRIDELTRDRGHLALTAPRAGTVVYVTGYRGDKRKVGDTVFRSEVIVQIVGLGAMVGSGWVDEVDVARLAPHQPVVLRVDALPDLELHGTLASIAASVLAKSDGDPSRTVRVAIAVTTAAGAGLRPGMRFRGQIETQRLPGVIQVATEAVFVTPDGPVAYREAAGGFERVPLRLGHRSAEAIEITSGLLAGDRVSRVDPEEEAP